MDGVDGKQTDRDGHGRAGTDTDGVDRMDEVGGADGVDRGTDGCGRTGRQEEGQ